MKRVRNNNEAGYTLVELVMAIFVLSIIVFSTFQLFTALVSTSLLMKQRSIALSLATSQMEYLKSLPYDNLAVSGGSIVSSNPIPATVFKKISGTNYKITTSINTVDDAFDGCGNYPTPALKTKYCRNQPAPTGAPNPDTNVVDYKIVHVAVSLSSGKLLSDMDSEIAARVAETASSTGALFVTIVDPGGNPLAGASVHVTNTTTSPIVDVSDTTDQNGIAIFYSLPPDTSQYDYTITGSLTGYSTLTTIKPSGSLQPNYSNINILAQQGSNVTLQLRPMSQHSLLIETVDKTGAAVGNVKLYIKGGYKKYTLTTDTSYYFDNMSPADTRVTTDASGIAAIDNLIPGNYYICGDVGDVGCTRSGTQNYLAAAIPYGGDSAFSPIIIPTDPSSPPAPTYSYNSNLYLQKVRIIVDPSSSFPRITSVTPTEVSYSAGNIGSLPFKITGKNLPCNSVASSCATSVIVKQAANSFTASCTGDAAGLLLNCTVNLTGAIAGSTYFVINNGSSTFTLPSDLVRAGINVAP